VQQNAAREHIPAVLSHDSGKKHLAATVGFGLALQFHFLRGDKLRGAAWISGKRDIFPWP